MTIEELAKECTDEDCNTEYPDYTIVADVTDENLNENRYTVKNVYHDHEKRQLVILI